jgi:predicted  nucleic acid-binding Zn-ribbon protein
MTNIQIPVSVGELVDKITILEIKSGFSNNEYIKKELNELKIIYDTIPQDIDEYMSDLREINKRLWYIEDKLRQLEKEQKFDEEFVQYARLVYFTNDTRARLKKEINEMTNSDFMEIKIYE